MTKFYLTEEEFDRLGWYEQMYYRWCPECEIFYHIDSNHSCNNYTIEVKK